VPLYQAMYSTTARFAPARVGQALVSMSSPLSEEKNDSASAFRPLGQSGTVGQARRHAGEVPRSRRSAIQTLMID
jgi:hypothetical protein